jgi:O-antigen/teichoic acid export membrane protein
MYHLQIKKNSIKALAINVCGMLLLFLYHVVTARVLSVDEYGQLNFVVSLIGLAGFVASMGFTQAGIRFGAAYTAAKAWDKLKGLVSYSSVITTTAGIVLALLIGMAAAKLLPQYERQLVIAASSVPAIGLILTLSGVLRGMHAVSESVVLNAALAPLALLGTLLAWSAMSSVVSLDSVVILYAAVHVGVALTGLLWINIKYVRPVAHGVTAQFDASGVMSSALPILFSSLMVMIFQRSDVLLLGTLSSSFEVARYAAAAKLAVLNSLVITAVNVSASPVIATLHQEGKRTDLQATLDRIVLLISSVSIVIFGCLVIFGRPLLALFGSAYEDAVPLLILLSFGQLFNALCGLNGSFLVMSGNERMHAMITTIAAIVNIVAQVMIIPRYGAIGAAVVTAGTTVLWNVLMAWAAWKKASILTFLRPAVVMEMFAGSRSRH